MVDAADPEVQRQVKNVEKALAPGIRSFIKKPILRNELAATVRQALDG
jgi:DNA-binding NarL/FixJ family response regulator